jgi:hypothetical protein
MSRLPPIQRLVTEDFPEQKKWLGKLLQPLNQFMESIYSTLNKNITIADNLAADIRTIELDGTFPVNLSWSLTAKPIAVVVGDCYKSSGASMTLTSAVQVQWQFNQSGQLQIDAIAGVTPSASTKYKVVLMSFTG